MKSIKSSFICMLFVLCLTAASKGQAQEFSVVLEEDRNFLLFIFHQDMRLVLIDHSDFPWFKRAHSVDEARAQELTEQLGALGEEYRQNEAVLSEEEIRRMNSNAQDLVVQLQLIQEGNDGWVVNYNPSDYDDLLRDELNRVPLNSDQFSYDQDQNQQQLIITNRALVLRARSFLRNNTAFTLAIKTNEGMYWAFYDQVADIEGMAALADQNSFTFCNLIEDIENFERRGYQNKEISGFSAREAMSSRGIACDRNNELLIVDNPSLEEYFIDELVITRTVDKSVICSEGANYRIHLAGTIGPDSSFALSELIDRSTPCLDPQGKIVNPTVVSLSSSGGLLNDGYAMGKAIRDANVTTLIRDGDICASSCAVAYLGGVKRIMQGESYVMFHAPYNVQPSNNLGSLVVNCDIGQDNLDELNNYYRDMIGFEAGDRLFDRTMSYCSAEDGWVLRGPASAELFGVATEK